MCDFGFLLKVAKTKNKRYILKIEIFFIQVRLKKSVGQR